MGAFGVDFLADTAETGVLDGAVASVDCQSRSVSVEGREGARVALAACSLTVEEGVVEHPHATEANQQQTGTS